MKTIHLFIIFIIVVLAQLFIPAQMILDREDVLSTGEPFKFKTQPVDPDDPLRGKYITLNYDLDSFISSDSLWKRNDEILVYLKNDSLGYAEIEAVSRNKRNSAGNYVKAEVWWYNKSQNEVNFNLPFDRFYMEESKAYDAELAYRDAQWDSLPNNTYALVYVKNGNAVLADVLINEIPIANYVEK